MVVMLDMTTIARMQYGKAKNAYRKYPRRPKRKKIVRKNACVTMQVTNAIYTTCN